MAAHDISQGNEIGRGIRVIEDFDPAADEFNFSSFSGGYIASAAGGTYTLQASDSITPGGEYADAVDHEGVAIAVTVAAGGRTALPPSMFPFGWCKFSGGGICDIFLKG